MEAEVIHRGLIDMQVCVPKEWADEEVASFAEKENPCGTQNGWRIRKAGSVLLVGNLERTPCYERADFVHVMLDA